MSLFHPRTAALLAGVAGLVVTGGLRWTLEARQAPAGRSAPVAPHLALLDESCYQCHDNNAHEAGLSLEAIAKDDVSKHPEVWEKVVRKLRTRQMPPVGEPRPVSSKEGKLSK